MEKSKVYFTDFRTQLDVSLGVKLQRLCRKERCSMRVRMKRQRKASAEPQIR